MNKRDVHISQAWNGFVMEVTDLDEDGLPSGRSSQYIANNTGELQELLGATYPEEELKGSVPVLGDVQVQVNGEWREVTYSVIRGARVNDEKLDMSRVTGISINGRKFILDVPT